MHNAQLIQMAAQAAGAASRRVSPIVQTMPAHASVGFPSAQAAPVHAGASPVQAVPAHPHASPPPVSSDPTSARKSLYAQLMQKHDRLNARHVY